jgi:DNA-directed RNA polymerase specialized sigma24 family protein
MLDDPAITSDDLRQDFEIVRHTKGRHVAISAYVRRRRIDAARRYTRRGTAMQRLPQRVSPDPVNSLISEEQTQIIHAVLRRATRAQQNIAQLLMSGHQRCEIAERLGVSRGAVTRMLQRLRPLLSNVR